MDDILISDITKKAMEQIIAAPPHSLMLIGNNGLYKYELAKKIVAKALDIDYDKLDTYQYLLSIGPEGSTISIDQVRALQEFVKLKTIGSRPLRRAVIIQNAHWLTVEAQNALLKVLEEPPADTMIVLTLNGSRALRPTIYSRSQIIYLKKPSLRETLAYYQTSLDPESVEKAYYMSGGAPKTIADQINNPDNSAEKKYIDQAKKFFTQTPGERLKTVNDLAKDKLATEILIENIILIANFSIIQAAQKNNQIGLRRWTKIVDLALSSKIAIRSNANLKLLLTNLSVQL